MAAPLCIASPESGGMADDKYVPNPVIASMVIGDEARGVTRVDVVDTPDLPPLHQVFGAKRSADGWILPELQLEMASPDAALHLGPIHIVMETAATEVAIDVAGTDAVQIERWHVMFVARGKVGPFRVNAEPTSAQTGRIGVSLTLHDEGNEDRVITTGTAVFRLNRRDASASPKAVVT